MMMVRCRYLMTTKRRPPRRGGRPKGRAEEKGRPAPTAAKMAGDFENTGGKAKSTSFKKNEKADTADHSDKSAKSPITKA